MNMFEDFHTVKDLKFDVQRLQKALKCEIQSSVINVLQKRLNTCIDSDTEA